MHIMHIQFPVVTEFSVSILMQISVSPFPKRRNVHRADHSLLIHGSRTDYRSFGPQGIHIDYRTVRIAHNWGCRLFTDFYLRAICPRISLGQIARKYSISSHAQTCVIRTVQRGISQVDSQYESSLVNYTIRSLCTLYAICPSKGSSRGTKLR
eukprot:COSAG02_NODE_1168_length_14134_cov_19.590310_5_plen_153_part_00